MNLQRIRQLAGIKLNESIEAVPTIGGSESDMQTAGTIGRDQAYAAYDASQTPATEELELGNDADTELGWYIIRATDGAIAAGPYKSSPYARRDAEGKTWYLANRNNYSFEYGFDDNGYFVDAELNENVDDESDWAERLSQDYEKNKGLEDGSEFDPKLDPKPRPQLSEQKLSRPYMLDRIKKLAGILTEGLDTSEESLIDQYKSGELSREEFMQQMDSIAATDTSMRQGEMGMQGDDTPQGNRAWDREQDDWAGIDDQEDDYEDEFTEDAKVDRFVGHVKKSEEKSGKSPKDAESIAWATANKRGMLDESSPHRAIVQQCMARLQELSDSFVDEEKAFEILEQELIEQGYDSEDIDYIKYAVDQEMNPHLHNDSDHSDDAGALASAGYGSDEDYGYYGGEDGMYEEKNISKLPQILKAEEINDLLTLPVDAAKAEAIELINKTSTKQGKKDYLIRQVESGLSSRAVVKLLYDMLLAGEGHRVQGSSYSRRFSEDFDLNNGYDDINDANGDDYFPDGADSPVIDATGAAGARQGDNPEQKKMQIAELHKELVYGYRKFLNESATESKKKLTENQQLVSKITPIKFHGNVEVDTKSEVISYGDEITLLATVLDKNNKPVEIQYSVDISSEVDYGWDEDESPTGWNYAADDASYESHAYATIGDVEITQPITFVDNSFVIGGVDDLAIHDIEQYVNSESLQQLLDPKNYINIIEQEFKNEAENMTPEENDGHYD